MSQPVVCFSELAGVRPVARKLSPSQWTCIGAPAIPLWAMWRSLALRTAPLPPLETLTLAFACGWISFGALLLAASSNPLLTWNLLLGVLVIVSAGLLSRTEEQADSG